MRSSSHSSRRTGVSPWVCVLVAGLVLATPALVSASPAPVAGHTRDAALAPNSVGFWMKVGSLGLEILSHIITALEEIEKIQEHSVPPAPPRADGPPWQPTENPAPQVVHIN
jgi:hypothetical protein